MEFVLLIVQIIISVCMIVVILLQKNNSDGLSGLGGGGNNMGFLSGRASANFMTRTTAVLAACFMINSLLLGNIVTREVKRTALDEEPVIEIQTPKDENSEPELPIAK